MEKTDLNYNREIAKRKSPLLLWERWGYNVRVTGRELRVYHPKEDGCLYRSVQQDNGVWLSSSSDAGIRIAQGVGDNISLFQYFEPEYRIRNKKTQTTVSFKQSISAINRICDDAVSPTSFTSNKEASGDIRMPGQSERGRDRGHLYLSHRGISKEVCLFAESQKFIRYADSHQDYAAAVFFVGYKDTKPMFANKRCIEAIRSKDSTEKRDLANSSKVYIPVIKGTSHVIFVEGGVNALSILEIFHRANEPFPTVIMTGGQGNTKWSKNEAVIEILKNSTSVSFMGENDFHLSPEKQKSGKELKEAQAYTASEIAQKNVPIISIGDEFGDVNDIVAIKEDFDEELESLLNAMMHNNTKPSKGPLL